MVDTMDRGSIYEHDIPSLSASLEAFDPERSMHSAYSGRSNMHSSRWSIPQVHDEAESDAESDGPWAPPAWQKSQSSNHWYRKSLLAEGAPYHRTDRELTPSHIPLPESPRKHTPRTSPEPTAAHHRTSRMQSPVEETRPEHDHSPSDEQEQTDGCTWPTSPTWPFCLLTAPDCRLAFRGETLFRTAPIEDFVSMFARVTHMFTKSRVNVVVTIAMLVLSWLLAHPWTATLIPDVANVANMARQFEPLLYASENVIPRSRELREASIAVQDLRESVRVTNMTASVVIVEQLDDLGENLSFLSGEIRRFFTNVDGDMDS